MDPWLLVWNLTCQNVTFSIKSFIIIKLWYHRITQKSNYLSNIRYIITKLIYCFILLYVSNFRIHITENLILRHFLKFWDAIFPSIHTSDKTTASTLSRINFRRGLEVWLHTLRPHFHPFSSSYKKLHIPCGIDTSPTTPLTVRGLT